MTMNKNTEITILIKRTVLEHLPGAEVRLFGSRARGKNEPDSDYDILVITKQNFQTSEKLTLKSTIRKELLRRGIRSDILIQSKDDISVKKNLPGHIIRNIMGETIIL